MFKNDSMDGGLSFDNVLCGFELEFTIPEQSMHYCTKRGTITNLDGCNDYDCTTCSNYNQRIINNNTAIALLRNHRTQEQGYYGTSGILDVVNDNSVPSGVEIKTIGLPCVPEIVFRCLQNIQRLLHSFRVEYNQFAGIHWHLIDVKGGFTNVFNKYPYLIHNIMALSNMALPIFYAFTDTKTRYSVFKENYNILHVLNNRAFLADCSNTPHDGKYLAVTPYLSSLPRYKIRPHFEYRFADASSNYHAITKMATITFAIMHRCYAAGNKAYFDISNSLYCDAFDILNKISNRGPDRKSINTFTQRDMKTIHKIRDAFVKEIECSLDEIDPSGEALNSLNDGDLNTEYNSERTTQSLLWTL